MRSIIRIAIVTLLVGGMFTGLNSDAKAWHEPTLVTASGSGAFVNAPLTDGTNIVWRLSSGTPSTVLEYWLWWATTDDHEPKPLARRLADFDLDDGIVIWSNGSFGEGITAHRLATGEEWSIATGAGEVIHVAISDGTVAWVRRQAVGTDEHFVIEATDVEGGGPATLVAAFSVADGRFSNRGDWWDLRVDGDLFYWHQPQADPDSTITVLMRAAVGQVHEVVGYFYGSFPGGAYRSFDVENGLLTFSNQDGWVEAKDFNSGTGYALTNLATTPSATDGRYVFWAVEDRNIASTLYAYDTWTNSRFVAFELDLTIWSSSHVDMISASEGIVAWDVRAPGCEIHAANVRDRLPSGWRLDPETPDWGVDYFSESGHSLRNGFRSFWLENGGLPVFGAPLTEEYLERSEWWRPYQTVQFTERQRFEWHSEHAGTAYEVLLGRLGDELLKHQGRDWTTFPKANPDAAHYFAETGHAIDERFWHDWSSQGLELGDPGVSLRESLALFGYPLSEPMPETNADGDTVLTQYFERAVFEWHPENPDPWKVLLRRLGAEMLEARGW